MKYPINETFKSWQGEGVHMGRRAYFIRLQGCDLRCSWCDQSETWPGGKNVVDAEELAASIPEKAIVIVTGGEPTLHDLMPLTCSLVGRLRHLETAGHRPITGRWSWIALSPKPARPPLLENVKRADEFKIIVARPGDIERGLAALEGRRSDAPVWLHPEWSVREDSTILNTISKAVDVVPGVRAGWQIHKMYEVR